ncbi:cytochrome P450 [Lasiosphaeria hispida]|uniref:Cytochrome P450 n=1 Tax=Lasiosphaeria hispida TaxID=260671 RepID=A0AAJ0HIL0_9PEZI|nr:cytochrome P450 [Lasiosphaeria hispida]
MEPSNGLVLDSLSAFRHSLPLAHLQTVSGLGLVVALVAVPLTTVFLWFTASWAASPLRKYPGPFLAGYTNLWRLAQVKSGDYHLVIKKLHEKYGPVVRIGPNTLDLDYPELIKTIYGTDGKWHKTEFYHNNSTMINGKIVYHMFSTTDQAEHARMKRPIVKYYSLSSVLGMEPIMDKVVGAFCKQLDNRFVSGPSGPKECDLGEWIAFYAWDHISSVTFSQSWGYMDKGHDFDNTIAVADRALDYFSAVGQMPWLDYVLDKNPVVRIGPPNLGNATRIAFESLVARLQGKDQSYDPKTPDYLQHFIDSKSTHPDLVDDGTIMGYLLVNILAGADTTAITLRAIFYFSLKQPDVYRRLEAEVRAAGIDRDHAAPYSVARQIPYLEAIVRESMRLHPSVSMLLERYVPDAGLVLPDGSHVPAGAAVGLNAYITGRNKSVWGDDADEFRPERWLRDEAKGETEEAYRLRMQRFNAADLSFGGGSRICAGRNLALVEIYKIVATLVNRYDIALADPNKVWTVWNSWFPRQKGIITTLKMRK